MSKIGTPSISAQKSFNFNLELNLWVLALVLLQGDLYSELAVRRPELIVIPDRKCRSMETLGPVRPA